MALQFGAALAGAQPDPKLLYEQSPGAHARPGVVTTVRGMGSNLPSWVFYHLEVGFCKLYIYLDDPEEVSGVAVCDGGLCCFRGGAPCAFVWTAHPPYVDAPAAEKHIHQHKIRCRTHDGN